MGVLLVLIDHASARKARAPGVGPEPPPLRTHDPRMHGQIRIDYSMGYSKAGRLKTSSNARLVATRGWAYHMRELPRT